jgi:hypothetical protein
MIISCCIGVAYTDGTWRLNIYNRESDGKDIAESLIKDIEDCKEVVHAWVISMSDLSERGTPERKELYDKHS